jgi:hypothetical protein
MKKTYAVIFIILGLSLMAIIFRFSSQNNVDTNLLSRNITEKIASVVFPGYESFSNSVKAVMLNDLNNFIRKTAHFALFFSMSAVFYAFFTVMTKMYLISGALSVAVNFIYAVIDEYHQSFVPGRTPLVKDVFIDTVGAVFGVIFCFMIIASIKLILSKRKKQTMGRNDNSVL